MRPISCAVLLAAVGGCSSETEVTQTREPLAQRAAEVRYEIAKFGSLGGTQSRGMEISAQSWVAGWSTVNDGTRRAALWRDGLVTNLGTLGGPGTSSMVPFAGQNDEGMIVGISHTDEVDPLNEQWSCEEGGFLNETNRICRGFAWENGLMRELPPVGGNHSFAAGVNNRGEVVGWAETAVRDRTCSENFSQILQFRAVVWEPKAGSKGKIKTRQLPPFGDQSTSAATAINDNGQVVGIAGDCDQAVGRLSARHAVLWEKDRTMVEIPNLGGTAWHTPLDINEQGDVAGFSNPDEPGDPEFIARAFFWAYGSAEATDLGTLEDDPFSQAFAINSTRQVVGISFGDPDAGPRGFLWENDVMTDLNLLVDSDDTILSAQDINDAGQITGRLLDAVSGDVVMFVATPLAN